MVAESVGVFLIIIVDFGFNISATREVANLKNDKEKISQFYWNIFSIKLALIMITFLLLLGLIIYVDKFSLDPLVYLFSLDLF